MMKHLQRGFVLGCVVALAAAATGCATSGDVAELNKRLDAMNASVRQMESRVANAERAAQDALRQAQQAQSAAAEAESAATEAARKSEAIFTRSVKKGG